MKTKTRIITNMKRLSSILQEKSEFVKFRFFKTKNLLYFHEKYSKKTKFY